jgi:DNA polymerase III gamma/tau subunit
MPSLCEQYRPADWPEVIGQEKAVRQLQAVGRRGFGGRAYMLIGKSGTGKTTLARIIGRQVAHSLATVEIDAADVTAALIDELNDRWRACRTVFQPDGHCLIVNECHGLTSAQIRRLLVAVEGLPEWCAVIFTTTVDGRDRLESQADWPPLLSRCTVVSLAQTNLAPAFAARAREIAQAEGLDGMPIEKYVRLLRDCGLNFRAALQAIEAGEMVS